MYLKSFAKVNLCLKVINKRRDGYHTLKTIFERISLADKIILKPRKDSLIKISSDNRDVPRDESNFCFKAAKLLRDKFRPLSGLDIKIIKRIPVAAGLGGGSSNAAAVLLGLNRLWGLKLSKVKLAKFAGKVGSDVAFFIYGLSFALGSGKGERIKPLNILKKTKLWHILVVPKIHVSTPLIYKKYDHFSGLTHAPIGKKAMQKQLVRGLTKPPGNVKLITSVKPYLLFNSLEQVTIRLYPEVRRIKDAFSQLGLDRVLMSGSGPAVFAITSSFKNASRLAKILQKRERPWRVFVVKTV
ncbi:MAG: 4-(cytidine 5'-diphospho)-2-C-methyl-D-erythritol kinase [Candidatus Omnitrophota bacterium]